MSQHRSAGPWFWLRGEGGAGRALVGVRHAAGLTQAEIAERLGMDRTTMIDIEAGRNTAVNRFVALFNRMGYDLIAVPRGARVTVEGGDEDGAALWATSLGPLTCGWATASSPT